MDIENVTVTDEKGVTAHARMPVCDCGERIWVVFKLEGQDHFHLQCTLCNTTYCPGGCEQPARQLTKTLWCCPACDSTAIEISQGGIDPCYTTLRCSIGSGGCGSETRVTSPGGLSHRDVWEQLEPDTEEL